MHIRSPTAAAVPGWTNEDHKRGRADEEPLTARPLAPACQEGKELFGQSRRWWRRGGSNSRPSHCERDALPAELRPHGAIHDNEKSLLRQSDRRLGVMSLGRSACSGARAMLACRGIDVASRALRESMWARETDRGHRKVCTAQRLRRRSRGLTTRNVSWGVVMAANPWVMSEPRPVVSVDSSSIQVRPSSSVGRAED